MKFGKKKRITVATWVEQSEIQEDICGMSLEECLEFVKREHTITHNFVSPHSKQKFLRLDEDSYQLICKSVGTCAKLEMLRCEDIKEVRYGSECFELLKLNEDVELDLCVTIKYKCGSNFLWETFSFEAFDPDSAQKWVHSLRTLQRCQVHKQSVAREREIFINRFPYLLEEMTDNRNINAKDLKVFLCDVLNYKLGTDELNDIMAEEGLQEGSSIEPSHLHSIYNNLIYDNAIIERYFKDEGSRELHSHIHPLFSDSDSMLAVAELEEFLSSEQADMSASSIVSLFGEEGEMTPNQFLDFLYSDENAVYSKSEAVEDLMDSPLSHYWIASSHNTFLTGNQIKSKSSVEAYVQALLSGCRCIELDLWDRQGTIMILHGFTLTTMVLAEDVLTVIDRYAFKVSPYPLILSIENHLGTQMQDKFAKMLKEILKDKLLVAPMEDGGQLPSPVMLKYKIIIKDKKRMRNDKEYVQIGNFGQDIIKKAENIYFESKLNANDWTKRNVFMSPDFLYYSYEDTTQENEDNSMTTTIGDCHSKQHMSELHLAEPWYWGTVDNLTATHYVNDYIQKMVGQEGPEVNLTGDFAIRPSSKLAGEYVLLFLDGTNSPRKIKIQARHDKGLPRYCIEEYHNAPMFESLYTLVKHYQRVAFSVLNTPTVLGKPIEEPRNFEKEKWFHYNVSLEDSEKRIMHIKQDGAFLVREQPSNSFRLVFRCAGSIKKCRIRQDGRLWIIGKSQFEGLGKLVDYYRKYPLYVTKNNQQIKLTVPVEQIPIEQLESDTYLEVDNQYVTEEDIRSKPDEVYATIADFNGRDDTEMTFLEGAIVRNVERDPNNLGWCVGDYGPRKRKKFPYKLIQQYDLEDEQDNKANPLGMMCAGMIQLKQSTPRIHTPTDNPSHLYFISIKCEGREEYRLGFQQREDMEKWFDAISNARKTKASNKKANRTKQSQAYANLLIYAISKPAPPEYTDDYLAGIDYTEMSSFDENKLLGYAKKPKSVNLMKFTNTCLARVYPKATRTNSSNYDPLLSWNYGIQLAALNYQTPDKPLQLNFGKFNFSNGGCGYVRKPEDMISGRFDPKQESFSNSIALFITVIGGRMLFSDAGNLPKVRVSLEGLECDQYYDQTRAANSSLCPVWDQKLSLLCLNPDMAMLRFEVTDDNDFGDEKFIGHCTFPVKNLRTGYRSVPLYDGYGDQKPMAKLLVYVEKENLKAHDPERELHRIRREILQLNEYLNDLEQFSTEEMGRLQKIEGKYFELKFDINMAHNNSSNRAPQLPERMDPKTRTLSRGKTYFKLSIKRSKPQIPKRSYSMA